MEPRAGTTATTVVQNSPLFAKRFRIIRLLGEGAASAVYHAVDLDRDNKEVALKVLTNENAFDENTLERFVEEIKCCQEIRHPNLVEAYDFIEHEKGVAFTMEYVAGKDLSHHVLGKKLTFPEIDKIFIQVMSALAELHSRGICHRDIKLENILLRSDGVVKVSDLGLVKRQGSGMTATGVLLGTAQYFPPEYIRKSIYDARGDVYATGLVLYELLQGERWLPGLSGGEAIQKLLKNKFVVPPVTGREITSKFQYILKRALAVDPAMRFASAVEMRDAFAGVLPEVSGSGTVSRLVGWSAALKQSKPAMNVKDFAGERYRRDAVLRFTALVLVVFVLLVTAFFARV